MAEWVWTTLRAKAVDLFDGELPNDKTEGEILDAFQRAPAFVAAEMEKVAESKRTGQVRSGWAIWRLRVRNAQERNAVVDDASERERLVQSAKVWIGRCGLHFDRESELLEELFERNFAGMRGSQSLRAFDTPELRDEMIACWLESRPVGEALEAGLDERLANWRRVQDAAAVAARSESGAEALRRLHEKTKAAA